MKKALVIVLIAFVVYFLLTEPEGMADVIGNIGEAFGAAFEAVITFFNELF
ncbi:MAG: hypothetical protein ACRDVZ_13455 [Jiangellaceae bacterium]